MALKSNSDNSSNDKGKDLKNSGEIGNDFGNSTTLLASSLKLKNSGTFLESASRKKLVKALSMEIEDCETFMSESNNIAEKYGNNSLYR